MKFKICCCLVAILMLLSITTVTAEEKNDSNWYVYLEANKNDMTGTWAEDVCHLIADLVWLNPSDKTTLHIYKMPGKAGETPQNIITAETNPSGINALVGHMIGNIQAEGKSQTFNKKVVNEGIEQILDVYQADPSENKQLIILSASKKDEVWNTEKQFPQDTVVVFFDEVDGKNQENLTAIKVARKDLRLFDVIEQIYPLVISETNLIDHVDPDENGSILIERLPEVFSCRAVIENEENTIPEGYDFGRNLTGVELTSSLEGIANRALVTRTYNQYQAKFDGENKIKPSYTREDDLVLNVEVVPYLESNPSGVEVSDWLVSATIQFPDGREKSITLDLDNESGLYSTTLPLKEYQTGDYELTVHAVNTVYGLNTAKDEKVSFTVENLSPEFVGTSEVPILWLNSPVMLYPGDHYNMDLSSLVTDDMGLDNLTFELNDDDNKTNFSLTEKGKLTVQLENLPAGEYKINFSVKDADGGASTACSLKMKAVEVLAILKDQSLRLQPINATLYKSDTVDIIAELSWNDLGNQWINQVKSVNKEEELIKKLPVYLISSDTDFELQSQWANTIENTILYSAKLPLKDASNGNREMKAALYLGEKVALESEPLVVKVINNRPEFHKQAMEEAEIPKVIWVNSPVDLDVQSSYVFDLNQWFTDDGGNEKIAYSLEGGSRAEVNNGILTISPTNLQEGENLFRINATDADGASNTECEFIITKHDVDSVLNNGYFDGLIVDPSAEINKKVPVSVKNTYHFSENGKLWILAVMDKNRQDQIASAMLPLISVTDKQLNDVSGIQKDISWSEKGDSLVFQVEVPEQTVSGDIEVNFSFGYTQNEAPTCKQIIHVMNQPPKALMNEQIDLNCEIAGPLFLNKDKQPDVTKYKISDLFQNEDRDTMILTVESSGLTMTKNDNHYLLTDEKADTPLSEIRYDADNITDELWISVQGHGTQSVTIRAKDEENAEADHPITIVIYSKYMNEKILLIVVAAIATLILLAIVLLIIRQVRKPKFSNQSVVQVGSENYVREIPLQAWGKESVSLRELMIYAGLPIAEMLNLKECNRIFFTPARSHRKLRIERPSDGQFEIEMGGARQNSSKLELEAGQKMVVTLSPRTQIEVILIEK